MKTWHTLATIGETKWDNKIWIVCSIYKTCLTLSHSNEDEGRVFLAVRIKLLFF